MGELQQARAVVFEADSIMEIPVSSTESSEIEYYEPPMKINRSESLDICQEEANQLCKELKTIIAEKLEETSPRCPIDFRSVRDILVGTSNLQSEYLKNETVRFGLIEKLQHITSKQTNYYKEMLK